MLCGKELGFYLFIYSLQMKSETVQAIDRVLAGSVARSWLGSQYEGH